MSPRLRGPSNVPAAGAHAPAAALALGLEQTIGQLELGLAAVRQALKSAESADALDLAVSQLMESVSRARQLTHAIDQRNQHQLAPYRERLRLAGADLLAQREALARATAALQRAADILVPADSSAYDAQGQGSHTRLPGGVTA